MAINQKRISRTRDIHNVRWAHTHIAPHQAIVQCRAKAHTSDIIKERTKGSLLAIIEVRFHFEIGDNRHRVFVGPIGEDNHMLPVEGMRLAASRLDDDRAVHSGLFLCAAMAVIPIGAALLDRKTVGEGFTG